jgi:CO/xanthine dehydrogenase Mo-binding subunit
MNAPRWPGRPPERLEARIVIERDGTITARSGKVEYGQGIRTGFALIVAEELGVAINRVRVELGETDQVPWDMGTFGSMSIAVDGRALRAAAARARTLLVERAAARFGSPVDALALRDGRVVAPDARELSYQQLTADEPLTGAIPDEPDGPPSGEPAADAPLRLEGPAIVTGRAQYVADVRLPGMLRGHIRHPPVFGAHPGRIDERRAKAMPGVVAIVRDGDTIGVVAERSEQARAAAEALEVDWLRSSAPPPPPVDVVIRDDGAVNRMFVGARVVEARYHVPHIAHASIGPSAAVADVRPRDADVYVSTHRPFAVRDEVAALLDFPPERVHVHPRMTTGLYGRGNLTDAPLDAVRLSRAVGRPVLVEWTREEEFRLSPHRPRLDAHLEAVLDGAGAIAAWRSDITTNSHAYGGGAAAPGMLAMTAGRNSVPPYRLGAAAVSLHVVASEVRTGPFRSLAAAPNVFAIESFVDELAHAVRQDPLAFRLRHVEDERLRRVLEHAGDASAWRTARGQGRGRGVACAIYHGTYVAAVAEVGVSPQGRIRLERVWCTADPGHLVHPDGARNQIEGAIQQAASWTLLEALRIDDGEVTSVAWPDYPIATFADAPDAIAVAFTADEHAPSTGIGEVGTVPTAAAIANAVFDACGARLRRLPLGAAPIRT